MPSTRSEPQPIITHADPSITRGGISDMFCRCESSSRPASMMCETSESSAELFTASEKN